MGRRTGVQGAWRGSARNPGAHKAERGSETRERREPRKGADKTPPHPPPLLPLPRPPRRLHLLNRRPGEPGAERLRGKNRTNPPGMTPHRHPRTGREQGEEGAEETGSAARNGTRPPGAPLTETAGGSGPKERRDGCLRKGGKRTHPTSRRRHPPLACLSPTDARRRGRESTRGGGKRRVNKRKGLRRGRGI